MNRLSRTFRKASFLIISIFLSSHPVYSNYPTYEKIESHLESTWNRQYPVPYERIVKKNINGKGILVYRKEGKQVYIYTFLVFVPHQKLEGKEIVKSEGGREVQVKLFYEVNRKPHPYWIELGELDEEFDRRNVIRYMK